MFLSSAGSRRHLLSAADTSPPPEKRSTMLDSLSIQRRGKAAALSLGYNGQSSLLLPLPHSVVNQEGLASGGGKNIFSKLKSADCSRSIQPRSRFCGFLKSFLSFLCSKALQPHVHFISEEFCRRATLRRNLRTVPSAAWAIFFFFLTGDKVA